MPESTPLRQGFVIGLLKDWGVALACALVAWFVWSRLFGAAPLASGPAPDFTLPIVSAGGAGTGAPFTLSAAGDGPVVLNFWFTTCPPCRAEIPELAAYHEANPDVPMYGVSIDQVSPGRLARLAQNLGVNYPVLHDPESEVAGRYGVSLFPTTIVVEGGKITDVHQGAIDREGLARLVGR